MQAEPRQEYVAVGRLLLLPWLGGGHRLVDVGVRKQPYSWGGQGGAAHARGAAHAAMTTSTGTGRDDDGVTITCHLRGWAEINTKHGRLIQQFEILQIGSRVSAGRGRTMATRGLSVIQRASWQRWRDVWGGLRLPSRHSFRLTTDGGRAPLRPTLTPGKTRKRAKLSNVFGFVSKAIEKRAGSLQQQCRRVNLQRWFDNAATCWPAG